MYVVIEHAPHKILGCHQAGCAAKALDKALGLVADNTKRDYRDAEDCLFHEGTWQDKNDEDYHITIMEVAVS